MYQVIPVEKQGSTNFLFAGTGFHAYKMILHTCSCTHCLIYTMCSQTLFPYLLCHQLTHQLTDQLAGQLKIDQSRKLGKQKLQEIYIHSQHAPSSKLM